jgi:hypothetical protein
MADTKPFNWRKSRRCDSSSCVEVAYDGHRVAVRDGKDGEGPRLTFAVTAWRSFVLWIESRAG